MKANSLLLKIISNWKNYAKHQQFKYVVIEINSFSNEDAVELFIKLFKEDLFIKNYDFQEFIFRVLQSLDKILFFNIKELLLIILPNYNLSCREFPKYLYLKYDKIEVDKCLFEIRENNPKIKEQIDSVEYWLTHIPKNT